MMQVSFFFASDHTTQTRHGAVCLYTTLKPDVIHYNVGNYCRKSAVFEASDMWAGDIARVTTTSILWYCSLLFMAKKD